MPPRASGTLTTRLIGDVVFKHAKGAAEYNGEPLEATHLERSFRAVVATLQDPKMQKEVAKRAAQKLSNFKNGQTEEPDGE